MWVKDQENFQRGITSGFTVHSGGFATEGGEDILHLRQRHAPHGLVGDAGHVRGEKRLVFEGRIQQRVLGPGRLGLEDTQRGPRDPFLLEALCPSAVRLSIAPTPRSARRAGGVYPFVPPPARRRLAAPSPSLSPPPVPASLLATRRCKVLPSAPGFGYNPHSF